LRYSSSLVLAGTIALGACATPLPSGPSVIGLPAAGRDLSQFQQEDASCRAYAGQQIGGGDTRSSYNPQQRYDIAYTQCMYSKGDTVRSSALLTGGLYAAYPPYGYPYYGPLFGSSIIGFGAGCCRGRHHEGHHAWGGQHGNWGMVHTGGWHAGSRS
jgi:hypothetical protein